MAKRDYADRSKGDKRSFTAVIMALLLGVGGLGTAGLAERAVPAAAELGGEPGGQVIISADAPAEFLRIHVVPHSNDPSDQDAKLVVRDAVLAEMAAALSHVDPQDWVQELNKEVVLERLRARAEAVLHDLGMDYGARVSWGMEPLSRGHRAQMDLPGARHPALRVVLGEGRGSNWWCVLFPPLCFVAPAQGFDLVQWAQDSDSGSRVGGANTVVAKGLEEARFQEGAEPLLSFRWRVLEALKPSAAGESFLSRIWE